MPISFTGIPSSRAIASAIPPFAVPSSFVSTMPVTGAASANSRAWRRPFCPVVASTSAASRAARRRAACRSRGAPSRARPSGRPACAGARRCRRSRRRRRSRARGAPPRTRPSPGREPGAPVTISQPARSAHSSSCSTAAARNVSAAPSTTVEPLLLAQVPGELADRRRLAGAVDARDHDHRRALAQVDPRVAGRAPRRRAARRAGACSCSPPESSPARRLVLEPLDDLGGRRRPDVGHDQRLLEALPALVVERVEQRRLDLGAERLARLREVLAQAPEEAAALLRLLVGDCVGGAGAAPGDRSGRRRSSRAPWRCATIAE